MRSSHFQKTADALFSTALNQIFCYSFCFYFYFHFFVQICSKDVKKSFSFQSCDKLFRKSLLQIFKLCLCTQKMQSVNIPQHSRSSVRFCYALHYSFVLRNRLALRLPISIILILVLTGN